MDYGVRMLLTTRMYLYVGLQLQLMLVLSVIIDVKFVRICYQNLKFHEGDFPVHVSGLLFLNLTSKLTQF
jgi:hypothetical protein